MTGRGGRSSKRDPKETVTVGGYQRRCLNCLTWLKYRSVGPPGAEDFHSYCPNTRCRDFDLRVESVHVS